MAIDNDNSCGGRILITTRNLEVAKKAEEVYKLRPLPDDSARELFHTRINDDERKHFVDYKPDEICDDIIRKCGGIPLAIITMASLLVHKPRNKWSEICKSLSFGRKDCEEAENTMKILSFSYYDLPARLRTCLLYLCAFPEDSIIYKDSLVWKWVAEGFVHKKEEMRLFEIGEGYFNDLVNRSMIQAVESEYDDTIIIGCRVHDMVLDFIRSMSYKENFFTILDNIQDTCLENNVHRLANHNWTKRQSHQANHIEMSKLRSFISLGCVIETWAPLSSFTLLRVLAIENCSTTDGSPVRVDYLGRLPLLRFLSLRGTRVGRIPKEIGALGFLQTLDLWDSDISEWPLSGSLPKQLACLRITLHGYYFDGKVFSVVGMTSLEELAIELTAIRKPGDIEGLHVKGLGCLRELRGLNIIGIYRGEDDDDDKDLVESLGHLDKLQRLTICGASYLFRWQPKDLVLSHDLQYLAVENTTFCELPSCINPSRLPNLSHLDLSLEHLDEESLEILGRLPELHYLSLDLQLSPATIRNISDSDACYFPKLRCFKLRNSMFSFVANKDDKRVSFHIWNGNISRPSVSVSDDELERARPSVSDDANKGSTICSKGAAEAPRFMPSLQVVHFEFYDLFYGGTLPNWGYNLGWAHLSSLREINVYHDFVDDFNNIFETEMRRAAEVHPNHLTINVKN